jgi:hypothetical protein
MKDRKDAEPREPRPKPEPEPEPDYRRDDFLRDLKKVSRRLEDHDEPRRSSRQD